MAEMNENNDKYVQEVKDEYMNKYGRYQMNFVDFNIATMNKFEIVTEI